MHMIERKQDALNGAMLRAVMAEHLREEREKVVHQPIQDSSFSALAAFPAPLAAAFPPHGR